MTSTRLVKCPYYTLEKWDVDGKYTFKMDKNFMNVSVIEGNGKVNGREISKEIILLSHHLWKNVH